MFSIPIRWYDRRKTYKLFTGLEIISDPRCNYSGFQSVFSRQMNKLWERFEWNNDQVRYFIDHFETPDHYKRNNTNSYNNWIMWNNLPSSTTEKQVSQEKVTASHTILCVIITYPSLRCMRLTPKSSYKMVPVVSLAHGIMASTSGYRM